MIQIDLEISRGESTMTPSAACVSLVQQFEGCATRQSDGSFKAYPDPGSGGDPWTIGWGSTGADIKPGVVWSQSQCDDRLSRDLTTFATKVATLLGTAKTTQNQFDAMVSFAYNVGVTNLGNSTLLKLHKAGNYADAANQFALWNKASGKVLPGLIKRRAAEAALYAK